MTATIVDPEEVLENQEQPKEITPDELVEQLQAPQEPEVTEDDIPEKYKGKSIKEVISMHQEAEKAIGKQGGELGELRGVVDEYIQGKLTSTPTEQTPQPPEEPVDYFEDPEAAVSHAIATHPDVVAAKKSASDLQAQQAAALVQTRHPDAAAIVQDPAFAEWVTKSRIRKELYGRADVHADAEAALELLDTWKERQGVAKAAVEQEQNARQEALRSADTGSTKGAAAAPSGKRRFRRADIIKLMQTDPDRYAQMAPEIEAAYTEGRVY